MSRIRAKDTKPEMLVRSWLHRHGYRFRLHVASLPGHPDIVLPRHRALIEVRGCFWHRHPGCRTASVPTSHRRFWTEKFRRNVERDRLHEEQWRQLGWRVFVVWECELAPRRRAATLDLLLRSLAADPEELPLAAEALAPEDVYRA